MADNTLYYGDDPDILWRHMKADAVGLTYIDPATESNRDSSVPLAKANNPRPGA